jgi:hypothetical protein
LSKAREGRSICIEVGWTADVTRFIS